MIKKYGLDVLVALIAFAEYANQDCELEATARTNMEKELESLL